MKSSGGRPKLSHAPSASQRGGFVPASTRAAVGLRGCSGTGNFSLPRAAAGLRWYCGTGLKSGWYATCYPPCWLVVLPLRWYVSPDPEGWCGTTLVQACSGCRRMLADTVPACQSGLKSGFSGTHLCVDTVCQMLPVVLHIQLLTVAVLVGPSGFDVHVEYCIPRAVVGRTQHCSNSRTVPTNGL